MSFAKLIAVSVLISIGRTNALRKRNYHVSSVNDENNRAANFFFVENDNDVLHLQQGESSIVNSEDEENDNRRFLFIGGDSGPDSGSFHQSDKLGAGLSIFGIPFGAEIGYTKTKETKPPNHPRLTALGKPVLIPIESVFNRNTLGVRKSEPGFARTPTKQRMVITKPKIHTIKEDQEPRRAVIVSDGQSRKSRSELSAGLEFFGIPITSHIVYDKNDGDDEAEENDSTVRVRSQLRNKYNVATKLFLG